MAVLAGPRRCLAVAALALVALAVTPSAATAACTVSTTAISFGTFDVYSSTPDDSSGTVTYRCGNTDVDITITLGTGGSGTYSPRRMTRVGGSEKLDYNLYFDATRSTIWGDGSGTTTMYTRHNPPNNKDVSLPFYGRVPINQDPRIGSYADTVVVTINF